MQPYGKMNGSDVYALLQNGGRLARPQLCLKNTYKIMRQCWEYEEEKRPTFRELNTIFQMDPDYKETQSYLKILQ